jgi:predicted RNA-binding Zn-ribbon protein involved in translation (DUF1610 family)
VAWNHRGKDANSEADQTTITVDKCPNCGEAHEYELEIRRSLSRYARAPDPRSYQRIFSCPKGGTFQLEITLPGNIEEAGSPSLAE